MIDLTYEILDEDQTKYNIICTVPIADHKHASFVFGSYDCYTLYDICDMRAYEADDSHRCPKKIEIPNNIYGPDIFIHNKKMTMRIYPRCWNDGHIEFNLSKDNYKKIIDTLYELSYKMKSYL